MKLNFLFSFFILFLVNSFFVFANTIPIVVRPLTPDGNLQPLTSFDYVFNFTNNPDCSDPVLSIEKTIVTDKYGIGSAELDVSGLNTPVAYVCEYRNNTLRKVHNTSVGIFSNIQNLENITTFGRVGIGTSEPSAELDVNGSIIASDVFIINNITFPKYYRVGKNPSNDNMTISTFEFKGHTPYNIGDPYVTNVLYLLYNDTIDMGSGTPPIIRGLVVDMYNTGSGYPTFYPLVLRINNEDKHLFYDSGYEILGYQPYIYLGNKDTNSKFTAIGFGDTDYSWDWTIGTDFNSENKSDFYLTDVSWDYPIIYVNDTHFIINRSNLVLYSQNPVVRLPGPDYSFMISKKLERGIDYGLSITPTTAGVNFTLTSNSFSSIPHNIFTFKSNVFEPEGSNILAVIDSNDNEIFAVNNNATLFVNGSKVFRAIKQDPTIIDFNNAKTGFDTSSPILRLTHNNRYGLHGFPIKDHLTYYDIYSQDGALVFNFTEYSKDNNLTTTPFLLHNGGAIVNNVLQVNDTQIDSGGIHTFSIDTNNLYTDYIAPSVENSIRFWSQANAPIVIIDSEYGNFNSQNLVLKRGSSQTANMTSWQDENGTDMSWVDANGLIYENGSRVCTQANGLCNIGGGNITGTGATNRIAYWSNETNIIASDNLFFDGTNVGIGTTNPTQKLDVNGNVNIANNLTVTNISASYIISSSYIKAGECSGNYNEGDICYNSTAHAYCYWNSTDLVRMDGTTLC